MIPHFDLKILSISFINSNFTIKVKYSADSFSHRWLDLADIRHAANQHISYQQYPLITYHKYITSQNLFTYQFLVFIYHFLSDFTVFSARFGGFRK